MTLNIFKRRCWSIFSPIYFNQKKKKLSLNNVWYSLKYPPKMVGCRNKANCLHLGPGFIGRIPSMGVFLRDLSPYLWKFCRNSEKTPNGYVDKHVWRLNPAPPVYLFRVQNHSATGLPKMVQQLLVYQHQNVKHNNSFSFW